MSDIDDWIRELDDLAAMPDDDLRAKVAGDMAGAAETVDLMLRTQLACDALAPRLRDARLRITRLRDLLHRRGMVWDDKDDAAATLDADDHPANCFETCCLPTARDEEAAS